MGVLLNQETFIDKLSDKQIQNFVCDFLKQSDQYYYESYKADWIKLTRENGKIRVMFDYYGVDQLILKDFEAYLICDDQSNNANLPLLKANVKLEWQCFLAKQWPDKYLKTFYAFKQSELKKELNEKTKQIEEEMKAIVKRLNNNKEIHDGEDITSLK